MTAYLDGITQTAEQERGEQEARRRAQRADAGVKARHILHAVGVSREGMLSYPDREDIILVDDMAFRYDEDEESGRVGLIVDRVQIAKVQGATPTDSEKARWVEIDPAEPVEKRRDVLAYAILWQREHNSFAALTKEKYVVFSEMNDYKLQREINRYAKMGYEIDSMSMSPGASDDGGIWTTVIMRRDN